MTAVSTVLADAPSERWLPVVDWEGLYEVSDLGRVRSLDRVVARGSGTVRLRGQIRRPSGSGPYTMVVLRRLGQHATLSVHRLVLTAFVGPCPPGQEGCHGPEGRGDNRLGNLRWDTPTENNRDAVREGTHGMTRRDRCKREHLLVKPNLCAGDLARGWRRCLSCHNARSYVTRVGTGDLDVIADGYYRALQIEPAREQAALEAGGAQ